MSDLVGKKILHYLIQEKLGEGGMGVVYKAQDTKLDRTVALKFLSTELTKDEAARKRFIQEAKAASGLQHNNICTIHEINETEDGQIFISMGFYEGETLKDKIKDKIRQEGESAYRRKLKIEEAILITLQIAKGLSKAQQQGIVHRDIKPANIMITKEGDVKILDFGLAKLAGRTQQTKTGATLGTVDYMSPEQVQGLPADHRTDIWSIGVILYEMLTGEKPFKGEFDQAVMYNIVNNEPEPVEKYLPEIPPGMQQMITRAMEKDPEDRYQTVEELLADLKLLQKSFQTIPKSSIAARKKIRKTALTLLPLLLIAIIITSYFSLFNHSQTFPERTSVAVLDFTNKTGEEELNGLSDNLITGLEPSRRIEVLPRYRLFDILKQLNKSDVVQIDATLGKEICLFANVDVLMTGSISKLGQMYSIKVQAINPKNDKLLFTAEERGQGQEGIFHIIDRLTNRTRKEFKDKENEIQATSQSIAEVTTHNFEAHQHYIYAEIFYYKQNNKEAEKEYRKAIEIDSTFGLAYYRLSLITRGEQFRAKMRQKALDLIDRIPERFQYLLRAEKSRVTIGRSASLNILKEMEKSYPNDKEMLYRIGYNYLHLLQYNNAAKYFEKVIKLDPYYDRAFDKLCFTYQILKNFERSLETAKKYSAINPLAGKRYIADAYYYLDSYYMAVKYYTEVLEVNPNLPKALEGLMLTYQKMNRYDKMLAIAKRYSMVASDELEFGEITKAFTIAGKFKEGLKTLQQAMEVCPNRLITYYSLAIANLFLFNEKYEEAENTILPLVESSRSNQSKRFGYDRLFRIYLYLGKYRAALESSEKLRIIHQQAGLTSREDRVYIRKALIYIWGLNEVNKALREAKKAPEFIDPVNTPGSLMNWEHSFLLHILLKNYELADFIRTEKTVRPNHYILLSLLQAAKGNCNEAEATYSNFLKSKNIFRPMNDIFSILTLFYQANCFFEKQQFKKAIKSILDLQGIYRNGFGFRGAYYPKSFNLLGQIYEAKGDTARAIQNYEKLLELWKNADKDLVDLIDAKKRLAKLKNT